MRVRLDDSGAGARARWSFAVATLLQRTVCEVAGADRDGFADAVRRLIEALPAPPSLADRADLLRRLLEFSLRIGRAFHEHHHAAARARCAFAPEACSSIWFDGSADPGTLLADWLACYLALFDAAHPAPAVQRAAGMLREAGNTPLKIAAIARAIGISRSVLLRQFRREFGMSPAEYRTHARLMIGIAALQKRGVKVCEAARLAGYRSTSNFNAALKKYLGMTPSAVAGSRGARSPELRPKPRALSL